jgi:D-alanyl-D-alanine carboxypeptidase/D-alanyl-D-alanine-endopeptidase (penicillin-binding protein 4)
MEATTSPARLPPHAVDAGRAGEPAGAPGRPCGRCLRERAPQRPSAQRRAWTAAPRTRVAATLREWPAACPHVGAAAPLRRLAAWVRFGGLAVALAGLGSLAAAQPDGPPAEDLLPPEVLASLRGSGLPASGFGFHAQAVDAGDAPVLASWNAEQPFLMASTAKIVTSLAALDLLGSNHRWRTRAFATAAPRDGRLAGDLVIAGGAGAGLTPDELRRWFARMHEQGLRQIRGRIVLEQFALLHAREPSQAPTTAAEAAPGGPPDPRSFTRGALVVSVRPGAGARAAVTLQPHPPGVVVINDVAMGGGCAAYARWDAAAAVPGAPPPLRVAGRWDRDCGRRDVAFVRVPAAPVGARRVAAPAPPPIATPGLVAALWAQSGGTLQGRVVESPGRPAELEALRAAPPWASELLTPLPEVLREINKTSNNVAARSLLRALGGEAGPGAEDPFGGARRRVAAWLRSRGLADDDIRIDQGSGQSRLERGKPRAMVQLLRAAWRTSGSRSFVDSLPIAGIDGTLAHRLRNGSATGQAFLKTGTLRDTRALAGYVRSRGGTVYAVAAVVNHPDAGRATPVLDAFIEWVARRE